MPDLPNTEDQVNMSKAIAWEIVKETYARFASSTEFKNQDDFLQRMTNDFIDVYTAIQKVEKLSSIS